VARRLGVSPPSAVRLMREHGIEPEWNPATAQRTWSAAEVDALAAKRAPELPPSRLYATEAAALLGIKRDRFNQLVRDHPTRLGFKRAARNRSTYLRSAVEALKRRREGPKAPAYPKRGSALTDKTRGQW
jgi:hypothetical protein